MDVALFISILSEFYQTITVLPPDENSEITYGIQRLTTSDVC